MNSRKSIFACFFYMVLFLLAPLIACARGELPSDIGLPPGSNPKILVAYFSQTGNTHKVAIQIHGQTGGDIFRIETEIPYPSNMESLVQRKNQELASGNMPRLKTNVANIRDYDVVFIGYPIWAMTTPPPIRSFIENHDLTGKIIVPFCTHDGYGPGRSVDVIKDLLPANTTVLNVFDIKGSEADRAGQRIASWVQAWRSLE